MTNINEFNPLVHPAGTVVATISKPWYSSKTLLFNGIIFAAASFVQLMDLLTGANILAPVVGIFVKDPAQASHMLIVLSQVYTAINMYLRVFKTNAPVSI